MRTPPKPYRKERPTEKNRNDARKAAVLGFLYLHEGREKLKNQKRPNKASPKGSRNPRKHCNMPRAVVQE